MTHPVVGDRELPARTRRRFIRLTATGVTVGVVAAAIVGSSGGTAAAATPPKAQSVGRFLDGAAGGMPIETLADLVDARAKAAPDTSSRNPLEADVLSQLKVPVGTALQLPGGGAFNLGVANQLAEAKTNGFSYGAAGAVANTGGVDLADKQGAYPSSATVDLSSDLLGSVSVPGLPTTGIPTPPTVPGLPNGAGSTNLAALGGVTATVGAIRALAQTAVGGKALTPRSSVADVQLTLGSPALGGLLAQLKALLSPSVLSTVLGSQASTSALTTLLGSVSGPGNTLRSQLPGLPPISGISGTGGAPGTSADCALTAEDPNTISLDNGGVVIDTAHATITVDVGKLLRILLGKDISDLDTSNFDLIDFLVQKLPTILSSGLESLVTGITDSLSTQFTSCVSSLGSTLGVGSITGGLTQLAAALQPGQTALLGAISTVTTPLVSASGAPLAQLAASLNNVADIGLNVQSGPAIQPHDRSYPFTTKLDATPDQATPVVTNQTLVRAVEVDILSLSSAPAGGTLPGLPALPTPATPSAGAVLALANAAAGPSTDAAVASTSTTPSSGVEATEIEIPTGVPAGAAGHQGGGSPALPIVVVLVGLVLAGGGVTAYRSRGKFSH